MIISDFFPTIFHFLAICLVHWGDSKTDYITLNLLSFHEFLSA